MDVTAVASGKKDNNGVELYDVIDDGSVVDTLPYKDAWAEVYRRKLNKYKDERYRKIVEQNEQEEREANIAKKSGNNLT
ncbi:hypothetical protein SAE02_77020 [Skermanella aerolata]|uniref:Uncharacterized protein n=1 Tax=Skermanella aerolata TaxID=393310 RepID=A0A512E481_9PROT|nr:hypothetical protein [Skermanella aerolata]GEO43554.1 hypothetical protein SAE02_77020 [Skermanella aerolata]